MKCSEFFFIVVYLWCDVLLLCVWKTNCDFSIEMFRRLVHDKVFEFWKPQRLFRVSCSSWDIWVIFWWVSFAQYFLSNSYSLIGLKKIPHNYIFFSSRIVIFPVPISAVHLPPSNNEIVFWSSNLKSSSSTVEFILWFIAYIQLFAGPSIPSRGKYNLKYFWEKNVISLEF